MLPPYDLLISEMKGVSHSFALNMIEFFKLLCVNLHNCATDKTAKTKSNMTPKVLDDRLLT